jgi:hypothetical protein
LTIASFGLVQSTVIAFGQVIVGAVVSRTVTLKLHVAELPTPSLAVQTTLEVPKGNVLPLAGLHEIVGLG